MNAVPRKRERSPVNPPSPLPTAAVVSSRGDVSSAPAVSSHPDHVSVLIVNIAANPVRFLLAAESDGFWPLNGPVRGSDDESWRDAAVRVVKEVTHAPKCTGVSIPAPSDILWIHRIEVPSMDENFSHILFCSRLSDHPLLNGPSPAVSSPSGDSASAPAIPSPTSSARGAVNVQWLTLQEVTTVDLRCSMLLNVLKDITSSKGQVSDRLGVAVDLG
ncbi:unnamed protein product [Cyprideis torosa]|uniref:Uncharacterized protein n=1 Tax=Cyprideis torosa TaxID=163714 RepID=A0A7R8WRU0_9CRUS|nr:unnamed protein product [Cyprideis torosa]CAG0903017.1 unnamed protein product [Cyprideis torosa]